MNDWVIYGGLSAVALALFWFWFKRGQLKHEKRWVLAQSMQDPSNSEALTQALQQAQPSDSGRTTWLVALIIIPASLAIQAWYFKPVPIQAEQTAAQTAEQAPDLATAIQQLEAKLAANPNDLEGQLLYARSMMQLQRFDAAVMAYQKANTLRPGDASILTELAEAIAFRNNTGSFLGEPELFLAQALKANPNHQKALWLQGIVHQEKQEFPQAVATWQRLLPMIEAPGVRDTITQQIAQAQAAMGAVEPAANVQYRITVHAGPEIMNRTPDGNTRLFVFAKAVDGPPMPVAAFPMAPPFQWPITVTLADAHSLMPERRLSQFDELKFSAKISLTGSATPAADDITSTEVIAGRDTPEITLNLSKE